MLAETDTQILDKHIPSATHVITGVGAGSWAQAVNMHYKAKIPSASFVAVEPEGAASLKASLEAGTIMPIKTGHTIMNGLNCGTVSMTAWDVLKHGVDASVTVTDVEVHRDLLDLHSKGVKNGPCGASTLSALRKICQDGKEVLQLDEKSVVVLFSTEGAREYVVPEGA
jgi:diaminopropionate ammonia-lyase